MNTYLCHSQYFRSTPLFSLSIAVLLAMGSSVQTYADSGRESIFIRTKIADPNGLPVRRDPGNTGGGLGPDAVIDALVAGGQLPNFGDVLEGFKFQVADAGLDAFEDGDEEELEVLEDLFERLEEFEELVNNKALQAVATVNPIVATVQLNALSSRLNAALNDLPAAVGIASSPITSEKQVSAVIGTFSNADPYITFQATFTNESDELLDISLAFEEGFLDPISADSILEAQVILDVQIEDTSGDGVASARSASWGMSIFATDDPADPNLSNTIPATVRESDIDFGSGDGTFGISQGELIRLETGTFQPNVNFPTLPFGDPFPDGFVLSQLLADIELLELSPGDTAVIRGIFTLGIVGDPLVPLIPANVLEAFYLAAPLVQAIPEPSSIALLLFGGLALMKRRRTAT